MSIKTSDTPEQLHDTWARLYRAKEKYEESQKEILKSMGETMGKMFRVDSETKQGIMQLPKPKEGIMLNGKPVALICEMAEDLRAALDYTVFQVSRLNNPKMNENNSQFPIADTKKDFYEKSKKNLHNLTKEQKNFVEEIQPFNGNFSLALLRDMTNMSKHRHLLSVHNVSPTGFKYIETEKIHTVEHFCNADM